MRHFITIAALTVALASPFAVAQQPRLDPLFQNIPAAGQPDAGCFNNAGANRNPLWKGITSVPGQTIIGGLIGAAIGNQIGSGEGKEIATGVGAALGAGIGSAHAHNASQNRVRNCQHYRAYENNANRASYRQPRRQPDYRNHY